MYGYVNWPAWCIRSVGCPKYQFEGWCLFWLYNLYIAKSRLCIEQECAVGGCIWWNIAMVYLYKNIRAGRERKSYYVYGFHERNLKDKP